MFVLGIFILIAALVAVIYASYSIYCSKKYHEKYLAEITISIIIAVACIVGGSLMVYKGTQAESFKRWQKDLESSYSGGLERTITVVNYNNEVIKTYEGKMDIQTNTGDKIVFVMDGKKYIIYNSDTFNTVFVEER